MQEAIETTRSVKWLMRKIQNDDSMQRLAVWAQKNLSTDPGHDYRHALRVALWGLRIGENQIDARELIAAALLHDLVNPPKDSAMRLKASAMSADRAQSILPDFDFDAAAVIRVCNAVRDHSFSRGASPKELLGKVLQDADRLEALGAIGIMRCVATGVSLGAELFDDHDPWAEHRPLDDKRFSIDHFFTKLLKLPHTMQTQGGRQEAQRRVDLMNRFLNALSEEIGQARPEI
jgi:uncharacterized protein